MSPKESTKQKLERFQRTFEFVDEVNFNKESRTETKKIEDLAHPETSSPLRGRRIAQANTAFAEGNTEFIRSYIRTLNEIAPNHLYEELLKKSFISPAELQKAAADFAQNHFYYVRLEDEINNLRLAASKEAEIGNTEPETTTAPAVSETPQEQSSEEPAENTPQNEEPPTSQTHLPARTTPRRVVLPPQTNKEIFGTKEAYAKHKEENKVERSERAKELWNQRKESRATPSTEPQPQQTAAASRENKEESKRPFFKPRGSTNSGNFLNNPFLKKLGDLGSKLARGAFRGLGNLASKLLPHASRALSALGRGLMNGLGRTLGNLGGRLASQAAGAAARSLITGVGGALAGVSITALFAWVAIGALVIFTIWSLYDSSSECGKPGTVEAIKTTNKESYSEGENIQYRIRVVYNVKCENAYVDIEIKDNIPAGTEFVEGSTKLGFLDPNFYLLPPEGTSDGNTITWKLNKIPSNAPVNVVFSVKPTSNDVWISNQASIGYKTYVTGPLGLGSSSTGGGPVPSGGGEAPNQDTCGGAHDIRNPLGNFGDPSCNYNKDVLYNLLRESDPANADYWFNTVVRCESSYRPNAHADHATVGTPDAGGAWGLYQMGRGKNGQYDHGDVPWQLQTTNAVTYNNNLGRLRWRYWQCARDRW